MNTKENVVFEQDNKQVIQKGSHFFTRIFENGESFESQDFNTLERAKANLGIEPTTEEKNRVLAEFLGETKEPFNFPQHGTIRLNGDFKTEFTASQLKFHSDWNWLFEVITRIESLGFEVNIKGISCSINRVLEEEKIISFVLGDKTNKILLVYTVCYEFIKWYNEQ